MKLNRYNLILLIACVAIASCKKHGEKPTTPPDVYNAGYVVAANTHSVAAYWKNGNLVRLADSTLSSTANAIAVEGNDVYVAGNMTNSEQITTAVIWKNGVATKLTDGTSNADAKAITINNGVVYVAGLINNFQAVYWRNNAANDLPASAVGNAIAVTSGNVYVAGMIYDSTVGNDETVYWKNGVGTEFIVPTPGNAYDYISGSASGIAVNDGNVYVTGYAGGGKYWENGTEKDLSNSYYSYPAAIAISGSDVYIAGSTDISDPGNISTATYWKNGSAVLLASNSGFSYAYSIALNGPDLYIGGALAGSAVYWKNGALVNLAQNGAVYSTFLVSH